MARVVTEAGPRLMEFSPGYVDRRRIVVGAGTRLIPSRQSGWRMASESDALVVCLDLHGYLGVTSMGAAPAQCFCTSRIWSYRMDPAALGNVDRPGLQISERCLSVT